MHDVMKHLNVNITLPAERLRHGVNIPFHGLKRQSTVDFITCACVVSVVYYIYEVLSLQCIASSRRAINYD